MAAAAPCRAESSADLRHWLNESEPVILALYDARADVAYWLFVRGYFAGLAGFDINRAPERVSVSIPRQNVLGRAAMRHLARQKNALLAVGERVVFHVIQ